MSHYSCKRCGLQYDACRCPAHVPKHLKYTSTKETPTDTTTQPKITGYRQLSEQEVLLNQGKALAEQCGAYIAKLRQHPDSMKTNAPNALGEAPLDQRWISIGATQLQQGWMAVMRGITQPTTF
jgi:hypothetical protein